MGIDLPVRTITLMEYEGNNDFSNEELQNKNLFIEVEKKKYPIKSISKPLKQTNFKNN